MGELHQSETGPLKVGQRIGQLLDHTQRQYGRSSGKVVRTAHLDSRSTTSTAKIEELDTNCSTKDANGARLTCI